jgi:hypothetical protein
MDNNKNRRKDRPKSNAELRKCIQNPALKLGLKMVKRKVPILMAKSLLKGQIIS